MLKSRSCQTCSWSNCQTAWNCRIIKATGALRRDPWKMCKFFFFLALSDNSYLHPSSCTCFCRRIPVYLFPLPVLALTHAIFLFLSWNLSTSFLSYLFDENLFRRTRTRTVCSRRGFARACLTSSSCWTLFRTGYIYEVFPVNRWLWFYRGCVQWTLKQTNVKHDRYVIIIIIRKPCRYTWRVMARLTALTCVCMILCRHSVLACRKPFPHTLQTNGLAPVCTGMWRVRL